MPELATLFEKVIRSGQFILGARVEAFERELAAYCGAEHAIAMSSGTDALLAAMMAIELAPGDEVITSPFTFFATGGSIVRAGGTPVFVDIDPVTYNIDPAAVEAAVTPRTRAIMPVHLFGQCADMAALNAIAQKHSLLVVEDAAQAIAAKQGNQRAGSMSTIGCLSFYPTKNLAVPGDGGACLTHDAALAQRLKVLRLHGQTDEYQHAVVGGNFRLDALKAGMLSIKLPHLDRWTQLRRENAARYDKLLAGLPVTRPTEAPGMYHVYNQYTLRVDPARRDALKAHLGQRKIGNRVYYPLALHMQPCFASLGYRQGMLPVSEAACQSVLSLPIYPEMTAQQQDVVVAAITEFYA